MIINYIKIALRNLKKHKLYSFINISGLAIGMACFILILLWVQDELSYDRFNTNADRICRVLESEKYGDASYTYSVQAPALASVLQDEYPEVLNTVRYKTIGTRLVKYEDKNFYERRFAFADPTLFEIFTFPFSLGNPDTALTDISSIVITEEMADKYFGKENPLGKTMRIDDRHDLLVTGVIKNIPENSHLRFDFVVPLTIIKEYNRPIEGWGTWAYNTYILLDKQADYKKVSNKIAGVGKKYAPDMDAVLSLQPITSIHLHSTSIIGLGGTGDIRYIYIFTAIAAFILLMACINFMNLATARSANRAKEVGLRKVVGAGRIQIARQFFNESILMAFIALAIAVNLVSLFLRSFNSLSGKQLSFDIAGNIFLLAGLLIIALATGIVSGSYPAIFLSSFQPLKVIRKQSAAGSKGSAFRKVMVVVQFTLTISLIIGTTIVYKQMNYMRKQNLGFNKDHVILIDMKSNISQKYESLKQEILQHPNILNAAGSSDPLSNFHAQFTLKEWEGNKGDEKFIISILTVDHDYKDTLQMEMVDGRFFSRDFPADLEEGVVVNEKAVKMMGMDSPVRKKIGDSFIIGVVKDFHFQSLHREIEPLVIEYLPEETRFLYVRVRPEKIQETLAYLDKTWNQFAPAFPLTFEFLDTHLDEMYRSDRRIGKVMNVFTLLAIFIACLGLFGLASFMAEQRTREIGIRKVLGASVHGIIALLSREFIKWVLIANLIACPIAFLTMNKWLQNFAYRTQLDLGVFLLPSMIAFIITILTVSYQAVRAALSNPADALRYE